MSADVVTRKRGRPRKTPPGTIIIAEDSSNTVTTTDIGQEAPPSPASPKRVVRKKTPVAKTLEGIDSQSGTKKRTATATVSKAAALPKASKGNPAASATSQSGETRASTSKIVTELKTLDSTGSEGAPKAGSSESAAVQLKKPRIASLGENRKELNKTKSAQPDPAPLNGRTASDSYSLSSPPPPAPPPAPPAALTLPSESVVEEASHVSRIAELSQVQIRGSPATASKIIDALRDLENSLGEGSRLIADTSSTLASARNPDSVPMAAARNKSTSSPATSTTSPPTPDNRPKVLSPQDIKSLNATARRSTIPPKPKDIRQTKEYKSAARRWVSTIVALPILFYTSWVLYERVYGGQKPKHLIDRPVPPQAPSATSESSPSKTAPK